MSTQTQRITLRLLFTTVFLLIVIITAWLALSQIKDESKKSIRESLYTVNQITKEAIDIWITHKKYDITEFIHHHSIISLTQKLLKNNHSSKEIIKSKELKKIRKLLLDSVQRHKHKRFFIIAPDMQNVAAADDASIGIINIIYSQRPAYLKRVFKGETLFVPTILSYDLEMKTQATIFIAAPLKNHQKKVIAALVFRLDPTDDFTKITQLGQIGNSGETYAFDKRGLLLTQSRFDKQLKKIGLISANQKSMISIRVSDPGGNMLEGFIPTLPITKRPFTFMVKNALSGDTNFNTDGYRDYRGVNVLGTWTWDSKLGFGLATEIDRKEAMSLYTHTKSTVLVVLVLTIILSFGLLFLLLKLEQKSKINLKNAYAQLEDKVTQRTKEFKESEEKFRTIFESSSDALILLNRTNFIDCNEAALNMFLCEDKDDFLNSLHSDWSAAIQEEKMGTQEHQLKKKMAQAFRKGELAYEWNYVRRNGDIFPAEVLLTSIYMNEEKVLQGTIRDISERKKAQEDLIALNDELERLSFLDGLTGIANRRMFDSTFEREWSHAQRNHKPLSLIFIDIDFFKQYNDFYGHIQGDICLKIVSKTLSSIFKRTVDLLARYGGEEFVIILPNTEIRHAKMLAQTCRNKIIQEKIAHEPSDIHEFLTISIGVNTIVPKALIEPSSFIDSTDKLLYQAKNKGRNRVESELA